MKAVTKEFYLREKHLPDWINLKDVESMRTTTESGGTRVL